MNPHPKEKPIRSEAYRRYVSELPCFNCHKAPPSQAAHADLGKGMAIKSSDLSCYPLCPACHVLWGASGTNPREVRREFERMAAIETQATLIHQALNDEKLRRLLAKLGLVK